MINIDTSTPFYNGIRIEQVSNSEANVFLGDDGVNVRWSGSESGMGSFKLFKMLPDADGKAKMRQRSFGCKTLAGGIDAGVCMLRHLAAGGSFQ